MDNTPQGGMSMEQSDEQQKTAGDLERHKKSYLAWGAVIGAAVPVIYLLINTILRIAWVPDYGNFIESLY